MDDVMIYYSSKLNKCITRRKVKPTFTPDHSLTQKMHAFRRRIGITEAYIDDYRSYIEYFNRKNRKQGKAISTWPNVYMKIMRALHKEYPELDFDTLTREYVLEYNLPCKTVAAAVEARYLEVVPEYKGLDIMI